MSGTTNLLIAPFAGVNATVHPVYSIDGLGVNDPPVLPISFGATDTFVDFTYDLPDDGNAWKAILVLAVFNPTQTKILTLSLEGTDVVGFSAISGGLLPPLLYFGDGNLLSLVGSNWRLTRANALDGAIDGWLRIYTFGDVSNASGTIFDGTGHIDLNTTPAFTLTATSDAFAGSCLFTMAARNEWSAGRDFSVTDPLTYTYSPSGSAGVGLLDNTALTGAALEFQFISVDTPTPSVEWTFTNVQVGERGAIQMTSFNPAVY